MQSYGYVVKVHVRVYVFSLMPPGCAFPQWLQVSKSLRDAAMQRDWVDDVDDDDDAEGMVDKDWWYSAAFECRSVSRTSTYGCRISYAKYRRFFFSRSDSVCPLPSPLYTGVASMTQKG